MLDSPEGANIPVYCAGSRRLPGGRVERRSFLARAALLAAGPFAGVACAGVRGGAVPVPSEEPVRASRRGYGRLRPVRDQADGEVRLHLPEGFSYRSFGVAGEPLPGGGV